MKKLIAIALGIVLLAPAPAQADVSKYVQFYPTLESLTLSAPVVDSLNNNYKFGVTVWNHLMTVNQVHFKLYDCNNLGQDTEWIVFNDTDNWGIRAKNKNWYIGDITLNYSAWSRNGVGICSGNWKLTVIVVFNNGTYTNNSWELKVANSSVGTINPANEGWIQNHINDIQKITDAWNAATKALKENQRIQAELKAKQEAEAWAAFLKEQEKVLRKFIGKPCKTLQKFKENEAGYLECINKKGKKVWGYLSLYN